MILTFLPNPSLDKVAVVPGFEAGGAFHAERVTWYSGGKGSHFGRVLKILGQDVLLVGPLGGHTGRFISQLVRSERLRADFEWIKGTTRTGLVVWDPDTGRITELYEPGPDLAKDEWDRLREKFEARLVGAQMAAVCGSFPPGAPADFLVGLVRQALQEEVPILLDTYGPLLESALEERPTAIKINLQEAGGLLQRVITGRTGALDAAREIQLRGAGAVILTMGSEGAVGVSPEGDLFTWASPEVVSRFPVGSGDSFFAGLACGLVDGLPFDQAARLGVAAGAANTLEIGPGVLDRSTVDRLFEGIRPF